MIEAAYLLLGLAGIIAAIGGVYFLIKLLTILSELVDAYKSKKVLIDRQTGALNNTINSVLNTTSDKPLERKVIDIPPEIIAPALKNPPKVAGGFGKKVD